MHQIMCSMMGHEEIEILLYNSCDGQNWPDIWVAHSRSVQCVDRLAACPCSDHLFPSLSSLHSVTPTAQNRLSYDLLSFFLPNSIQLILGTELLLLTKKPSLPLALGWECFHSFHVLYRDFHVSLLVYFLRNPVLAHWFILPIISTKADL